MSPEIYVWNLIKSVCERTYLATAPHNPQKPFLLVTLVSANHEHVLGGAAGVTNCEFQFDAVSTDLEDTFNIIEEIRNLLDGFHDEQIVWSVIQLEQDLSMPPTDDSPYFLYRKAARYLIRIKESIPAA